MRLQRIWLAANAGLNSDAKLGMNPVSLSLGQAVGARKALTKVLSFACR